MPAPHLCSPGLAFDELVALWHLRSSKDYCPYCTKAKNALFSVLSKEEVDVEEVIHTPRLPCFYTSHRWHCLCIAAEEVFASCFVFAEGTVQL